MSQIRILLDLAAQGKLDISIQQLEQVRDTIKEATQADKARATQAIETNRKLREGVKSAAKEEQRAAKEQEKAQKDALRLLEQQRIAEAKKQEQLRQESTLIGKIQKQLRDQRAIVAGAFDVQTIAKANKEIQRLSGEMRNLNNAGKQSANSFGAALGSFQFKFNFLGNLAGNIAFQLGQAALKIASDAVKIPAAFDKAADELQSITGASAKDIEFYKQAAIELGPAVGKSATEVLDAYKLIGSAKPELLKNKQALTAFTKEVLVLSKASKEGLSESATQLTDAMNQFGAPAEEAARYINVLAAGAKEGAAEIPQITEALLKFGVAAKSSNISIEESTALIETLAEKGLKGADAGTALRNVLAKLSAPDTLGKTALAAFKTAGVNIQILADNSIPLSKRLEELAKIEGNASAITKVFGLENKNAAQVLIENRKRVDELTKSITNTNAAYEQAAINTDNLSGDLDKARAAYESMILSFDKGDGELSKLARGGVQLLTQSIIGLGEAFKTAQQRQEGFVNAATEDPLKKFVADLTSTTEARRKALRTVIEARLIKDVKEQRALQKKIDEGDFAFEGRKSVQNKLDFAEAKIEFDLRRLEALRKFDEKKPEVPIAQVAPVEEEKKKKKRKKDQKDELDYTRTVFGLTTRIGELRRKLATEQGKDLIAQRPEEIKKIKDEIKDLYDLLNEQAEKKVTPRLQGILNTKNTKLGVSLFTLLKDEFVENADDIVSFATLITNKLNEISQHRIDALQRESDQQAGMLDLQRARAEKGLSNTLAFETQRARALENQRVAEQKRQERREKRLAFFNALASYAKEEPQTALAKAVALLTLAESIPVFERGGIAGDGSTQNRPGIGGTIRNGIFSGRSHRGGGILIEAEANEGILSRREMATLGKDNFYSLKDSLAAGRDFSQMLQGSVNQMLVIPQPKVEKNQEVVRELQQLRKEVAHIQSTSLDLDKFGQLVASVNKSGKTTVTTFKRKW
jgi:TP901 family phage tail tape measure protein